MTLTHILHTFVSPRQIAQIVEWNKQRNNLEFSLQLERDLLQEEISELIQATDPVDVLDAMADVLFVLTGTVAKMTADGHDFDRSPISPEAIEFALTLGFGKLSDHLPIAAAHQLLSEVIDVVIEANNKKPTKKDKSGKIIKGAKWTPPEPKIKQLLKQKKQQIEQAQHTLKEGLHG